MAYFWGAGSTAEASGITGLFGDDDATRYSVTWGYDYPEHGIQRVFDTVNDVVNDVFG